jgi:hypothetical protein
MKIVCFQCGAPVVEKTACDRCKTIFCSKICMEASWEKGQSHRASCSTIAEAYTAFVRALKGGVEEVLSIEENNALVGSSSSGDFPALDKGTSKRDDDDLPDGDDDMEQTEDEDVGPPPHKKQRLMELGKNIDTAKQKLVDAIQSSSTSSTTTSSTTVTNVAVEEAVKSVAATTSQKNFEGIMHVAMRGRPYMSWLGPIWLAMSAKKREAFGIGRSSLIVTLQHALDDLGKKPAEVDLLDFSNEYQVALRSLPKAERRLLHFDGMLRLGDGDLYPNETKHVLLSMSLVSLGKCTFLYGRYLTKYSDLLDMLLPLVAGGCRTFVLQSDGYDGYEGSLDDHPWNLLVDVIPFKGTYHILCKPCKTMHLYTLLFDTIERMTIGGSDDASDEHREYDPASGKSFGPWLYAAIQRGRTKRVDVDTVDKDIRGVTILNTVDFLREVVDKWAFWKTKLGTVKLHAHETNKHNKKYLKNQNAVLATLYDDAVSMVETHGKIDVKELTVVMKRRTQGKLHAIIHKLFVVNPSKQWQ